MQYGLTEEQVLLRDTVRKLAKEKVEPGAGARDQKGEFSWEMVELIRENGLFGVDFPEEHGGSRGRSLSLDHRLRGAVQGGCLHRACSPWPRSWGLCPSSWPPIRSRRKRFLPALASGEKLSAFALTEASGGSDVAAFRSKAVKKGDYYVLNGTKTFITNGGVADTVTVYALTDPAKGGHKGSSVFVVEKGTKGFSVGKHEDKMGIRSSDTVELIFEDCLVPAENLLAGEGMGFAIMMKTLDFSRPAVGAQALGIAAGAFEYALNYAKERVAFGKPIIAQQGISFKLADMAMNIEAARQLLYKTASVLQELPKDMSRISPETIRLSSMSKCFCADMAMQVTVEAVQVLGGYGYVKEYPVERYMRDAKITQIYEGTNEIQRVVIMSTF